MTEQRLLDFNPGGDSEAKRRRCERLLASLGDKRITTADRIPYFDAQAQAEAERLVRAAAEQEGGRPKFWSAKA